MTKENIGHAVDLMTTHFCAIRCGSTVAQALEAYRKAHEEVKGDYVFILDAQGSLIGFISLSSLLIFNPGEVISEDTVRKAVAVRETDTREKIARLVFKYKLEAIPVVDEHRKILGIVAARDAVDYLLPKAWKK